MFIVTLNEEVWKIILINNNIPQTNLPIYLNIFRYTNILSDTNYICPLWGCYSYFGEGVFIVKLILIVGEKLKLTQKKIFYVRFN